MMKRYLSILLSLAMFAAVSGCGRMQTEDRYDKPGDKTRETLKKDDRETMERDQTEEGTNQDTLDSISLPAPPTAVAPGKAEGGDQPSSTSIDFEYEWYQDGVMITRYLGMSSEVIIPDEIDGMPVTKIREDAFRDSVDLTGITLSGNISEFWLASFTDCKNLKYISVDKNNQSYSSEGGVLFDKPKARLICYPAAKTDSSFIVPDGVLEIGLCAFSKNPFIKSVIIPDSVRSIEFEAFAYCTGLENIILPEGLKNIDASVFSGCSGLKAADLPGSSTGNSEDYILAMSSLRLLARDDIKNLANEEIAYARNEIYARHGYVFQKQKYKDYFGTKSWYRPDPDFKESDLSEIEKSNVDFLLQYEGQ